MHTIVNHLSLGEPSGHVCVVPSAPAPCASMLLDSRCSSLRHGHPPPRRARDNATTYTTTPHHNIRRRQTMCTRRQDSGGSLREYVWCVSCLLTPLHPMLVLSSTSRCSAGHAPPSNDMAKASAPSSNKGFQLRFRLYSTWGDKSEGHAMPVCGSV